MEKEPKLVNAEEGEEENEEDLNENSEWMKKSGEYWAEMDLEWRQDWLKRLAREMQLNELELVRKYLRLEFEKMPYKYRRVLAEEWEFLGG